MPPREFSTLAYYNRLYADLRPEFTFQATDSSSWRTWKAALTTKLTELLGGFPADRCPLNADVLDRVEEEDFIRERVVFDSEFGASVPAYLLLPKTVLPDRRGRALLCLHGHGRGKDDVVGIAATPKERQQRIRPLNYDYARQFVQRGYVVLAPDARAFGERAADGMGCTWAMTAGLLLGKTLVGLRVWDAMRAIDYLQARPEVDPERIGCVGLSWGGTHTMYTAALDEQIKVAVISGYFDSFKDMLIDAGCCPCQYVPQLLRYADLPDIVSLIAPRPLLLENGTEDPLYTLEVVQQEYAKVAQVYQLLGASRALDRDLFPGQHRFSGRKAFAWVDQQL
jgi:dienelactone hydrolase